MKRANLPLPVLILILATMFLLASSFGEWVGRPASASRAHPVETVEQQQAAIVYVRVISWLSRVIIRPAAYEGDTGNSAGAAEPANAPSHGMADQKLRSCALHKFSWPFVGKGKVPSHRLPSTPGSLTAAPAVTGAMRDSDEPAGSF